MTGDELDVGRHLDELHTRITWGEIARRAEISIGDVAALRGVPRRVREARRVEAARRVLALDIPAVPVPVRHPSRARRRRADIQDALTVGLGWDQIADDLGISLPALERWCNRHGHSRWAAACRRAARRAAAR